MDFALGEDNRVLRVFRGEIYLDRGQYELARMDFEKAWELAGAFDPNVELVLASLGEAMGETGAVQASRGRVLEHGEREPVSPYLLALFYFALGRNDEEFALLERAYAERDGELGMLKVDPRLASRRSDPRYAELLKRVGLARWPRCQVGRRRRLARGVPARGKVCRHPVPSQQAGAPPRSRRR
jgi:tetratricopeptide (TPR) repeat protein